MVLMPGDPEYDREPTIHGRPDIEGNPRFGWTEAKRFPPYVYGRRTQASLVHRVAGVDLQWYGVSRSGHALTRLDTPQAFARTVCGMTFFLHTRVARRSCVTCVVPAPDAVLCGRCHGQAPTFGRGGEGTKAGLTRRAAHLRLGCVVEGE